MEFIWFWLVAILVAGYVLLPRWTALQQGVQVGWSQVDVTLPLIWTQSLWDAWLAPFQTWRGIDLALFDTLPTLPATTAAVLFVIALIGWIVCNRFLLPGITLTITPRRTP